MLTELRVDGYKAFRVPIAVPLRPLTILLGKNSSGKTALARLPLTILAGAARRPRSGQPLPLTARGLVLGSSSADLVHGRLTHGSFAVGMTTVHQPDAPMELDVRLQLAQTLTRRELAFVSSFRATPLIDEIHWRPQPEAGVDTYSDMRVGAFSGLLPEYRDEAMRSLVRDLRDRLEREYARLMHLASIRTALEAVYEKRALDNADDVTGAESVHLLVSNDDLLSSVGAWYQQHLRVRLAIEAEASSFGLWVTSSSTSANLARAGQGYQQVLPVITYLCGLIEDLLPLDVLVVEEPELHLHPAVHGAVADLCVAAVSAAGRSRQVIVETHSENLVLRVRRHVAAGALDPALVNILWLDDSSDGATVREILIREDGSVTAWPSGVFSEDLDEVRAIAQEGHR
jgi:hypothetical protein